jgi:uncharacterized surface protein with fasciclin (FAS1) repeats
LPGYYEDGPVLPFKCIGSLVIVVEGIVSVFPRFGFVAAVSAMLALNSLPAKAADDIWLAAEKAGTFNQFLHAARLAGLEDTLKTKGPITVFAPNDQAFGHMPPGSLFKLLQPENKALLASLVKSHIVNGAYPESRLLKAKAKEYTVTSVAGSELLFKIDNTIKVGTALMGKPDIEASNGTVHPVSEVLIPTKLMTALAQPATKKK